MSDIFQSREISVSSRPICRNHWVHLSASSGQNSLKAVMLISLIAWSCLMKMNKTFKSVWRDTWVSQCHQEKHPPAAKAVNWIYSRQYPIGFYNFWKNFNTFFEFTTLTLKYQESNFCLLIISHNLCYLVYSFKRQNHVHIYRLNCLHYDQRTTIRNINTYFLLFGLFCGWIK